MRQVLSGALALVLVSGCTCDGEPSADAALPDATRSDEDGAGEVSDAYRCEARGPEICNGVDDDCNGMADERFVLRCSSPEPGVVEAELTGDGFAEGVVRNLLRGNDRGLALPPLPDRTEHLWVASSADDFVSKVRIRDGEEVGRFGVGNNPSRTAVDGNGDAWVAMRGSIGDTGLAGEALENVVKIDGACTPAVSPPLVSRECILLDVPEVGNLLRGIAVDARGDVWVGAHASAEVVHLHGETGAVLERIPMRPMARPYGVAVDADGYVWVAAVLGDVHVLRIDPATSEIDLALDYETLGRRTPYGIAPDATGGVWFGSNGSAIFRVDATSMALTHAWDVGTTTRGVAVDDRGVVWAADSGRDAVIATDPMTGMVLFETPVGSGPVGVAIDHDGVVWAANQFSDSVSRIDPVTGAVLGTHPVGRNPYTYSDMTGSAFRVFRRLRGTFVARYTVGAPGARWMRAVLDAMIPAGASAAFRLRAGDDTSALDLAAWTEVDLASGEAPLSLTGAHLDVEVVLSLEDRGAPPPYVESLRFTVEIP